MMPVRKSLAILVDGPPRENGRPNMTWVDVKKIDLKKCNLYEDLAYDRSEWRNKIHVADPNIVGTRLW